MDLLRIRDEYKNVGSDGRFCIAVAFDDDELEELVGRISDECKNVGSDGEIRITIAFDADELEEWIGRISDEYKKRWKRLRNSQLGMASATR